MPDTKKKQQTNSKTAKSSNDEMPKGNSSKPMNKNADSKEDTKSQKRTSSSSSK
jgi:hypothetical protein